ncbi:MAG: hypothetical protein PWR07_831 [Bacillota bacterium]|nr:hypothetical protein [Bacillota bacterium]MDK2930700.1 hypothetical protein [Bacillota bacterium]
MGGPEGIIVKTETVLVERVVCRLAREVTVSLCHEAPEDAREAVDLAIDVLDPSWEVFDGSALASATLMVWAYCLVAGGLVRAVSWAEDLRVLVEDAAFRSGMRVEACFGVALQRAWVDGGDACATGGEAHKPGGGAHKIGVVATVRIDGLVLETVVLPVVTGVETREGCGDLQLTEEDRPEQPGQPERAEQPEEPEQPAPGCAQAEDRRRHSWIRRVLERLRQLSTLKIGVGYHFHPFDGGGSRPPWTTTMNSQHRR